MTRALLTLGLIGVFVYTISSASPQPIETAPIQSKIEVHSVVVDTPRVISLSRASPETWDTLPPVQEDEELLETLDAARASRALNEIELLKVNSPANIRSGPSTSAEIIGVAYAGAQVQVASRNSGWVRIIDPWSLETGWIYSKFLTPFTIPSAPARGHCGATVLREALVLP